MSKLIVPVTERDHIRGPVSATVTIVEYGDFECPFCGRAYWVLRDLETRYRRDLRVVFRHFPLTQIHPLAMSAAEAAEAAAAQGKFWEMHDTLYEHQPEFELEDLIRYADDLELDLDAFTDDLAGHRHLFRIRDEFMSGVRSGVNGTPCFFINGWRFEGSAEAAPLSRAVEQALQQQRRHASR